MRRVLTYAAVYGSIGVVVGVLMALATKDATPLQAFRPVIGGPNHVAPGTTVATQPQPTEVPE